MRWRLKISLIVISVVAVSITLAHLPRAVRVPATNLSGDGCLVLAYHRVTPRPALLVDLMTGQDDYTVYVDDFTEQMVDLKSKGVQS
jgi:hypothetical protein